MLRTTISPRPGCPHRPTVEHQGAGKQRGSRAAVENDDVGMTGHGHVQNLCLRIRTRRGGGLSDYSSISRTAHPLVGTGTTPALGVARAHRSTTHHFRAMRSALLDFEDVWRECGCQAHPRWRWHRPPASTGEELRSWT